MLGANAVYRARASLGPERTDALVLMCSDQRYRPATEEFLAEHLGLTGYDTLAVPGGAYVISFADALPKQLKVGMRMLRFVIKSSEPRRIVLIAHQDCGRYLDSFATVLRRAGFSMEEKQRHDLASVAKELRESFSNLSVDAYFARLTPDQTVEFEPA